jgi:hypothetical protein
MTAAATTFSASALSAREIRSQLRVFDTLAVAVSYLIRWVIGVPWRDHSATPLASDERPSFVRLEIVVVFTERIDIAQAGLPNRCPGNTMVELHAGAVATQNAAPRPCPQQRDLLCRRRPPPQVRDGHNVHASRDHQLQDRVTKESPNLRHWHGTQPSDFTHLTVTRGAVDQCPKINPNQRKM